MPATLGLAKFTATGKIDFYLSALNSSSGTTDVNNQKNSKASDRKQNIIVEIKDPEDLRPLCDAINAVSSKTLVSAELKDVDLAGNPVKACILFTTASDHLQFESNKKVPNNIDFILFHPVFPPAQDNVHENDNSDRMEFAFSKEGPGIISHIVVHSSIKNGLFGNSMTSSPPQQTDGITFRSNNNDSDQDYEFGEEDPKVIRRIIM